MRFENFQGLSIPVVDPPYEMVGDFLSIECHRADSWPLKVILPAVETIRKDYQEDFCYGGDAYTVDVKQNTVILSFVICEPIEECEIPIEDFHQLLLAWRSHF